MLTIKGGVVNPLLPMVNWGVVSCHRSVLHYCLTWSSTPPTWHHSDCYIHQVEIGAKRVRTIYSFNLRRYFVSNNYMDHNNMKSPETILSTISNMLFVLVSQNQWLVIKVFASYNILQYLCDSIHVLIFVNLSKCRKNLKLTIIMF